MDILKEFQNAIEIDRICNLQDFEEQMGQPLDERVKKGVTMSNLKVEFDFCSGYPNQWSHDLPNPQKYISSARIICDNNISKFKEGNSVLLSNGLHRFEMNIEEDSTLNFILKPNDFNVNSCYINSNDYPKNNWEINAVQTDIGTKLLLIAAQLLNDNDETLSKLGNFINGKTKNDFKTYSQKVGYLNDSQNTAYLKAINSSDFCIIQGPPGTGKTETIANITKHLIDSGLKVFITAPTHTAINNCLHAIAKIVKDSKKVVKIGENAQNRAIQNNEFIIKKTRLQYPTYQASSEFSKKGIAIGATPYSLCYDATKRLRYWEFDVCIVDEASQLSIPLAIAAMCRTAKYIFVGDHKQLDPIIPKNTNNEMFAESIFSRLARIYPDDINLLNTSYRLNETLIKIPNALFYDNRLHSDSTTRLDNIQYQCTYHTQVLNNDSHILLLHNVFDAAGRSPHEAKLVAELVSDLLKNGVNLSDIGIMSPYRAQVREIKKEIKKIVSTLIYSQLKSLFVDTVDSMQGQERNYIIYSMANSHPLESMRRLDFFYSPNRLNVAITRAIKKCVVIANYKVFNIIDKELKDHKEYQSVKSSLDIFKQYSRLATKIEIIESVDDNW